MKLKILFLGALFFTNFIIAQNIELENKTNSNNQPYKFTTVIDIEASNVKSQGNTGTCWSFSTSSFIESEIFKNTGKMIDLSEMYNVYFTYRLKSWAYVMRQGKIQFSEGGLAHDVLNSIELNGLVPETTYSGIFNEANIYDHSKIVPELKIVLDAYIKNDLNSKYANWKFSVDSILNNHIGSPKKEFTYNHKKYTPKSFLKMTKFKPNDYITLTSFTHRPYNYEFVLNIPDNFSNGDFYNIELNQLVNEVDNALKNGYTLALDCDVSEKTFSSKYGIAVLPKNSELNAKSLLNIVEEKVVTPEFRQQEFENYNTTDDHLMHLIGLVKDQNGNEYYKIKNSWGTNSKRIGNEGYIYMSKPFFKLKTISVLVNKNGLSKKMQEKIKD